MELRENRGTNLNKPAARRKYVDVGAIDPVGWSEWIYPTAIGHRLACCDCNLVHEVDFRVVKGRAEYRMRRDRRSTASMRRGK